MAGISGDGTANHGGKRGSAYDEPVLTGWCHGHRNANQIITFVLLLFNIVSSAALILISQYLGAGKEKKAVQFYSLSLFLNGSASFLLSVLFILAARPLFTAMRVPGEALSDCILYFRCLLYTSRCV